MLEENKELHRRVRSLEEIAARVEANELWSSIEPNPNGARIITHIFDNRDAESLKHLAQALMAHPFTVALLGSRDKGEARLVFARSADAPGDMNALMRRACELLNGRGGGKADLAQGGGKKVENLARAIEQTVESLN
jgi:alanyl-tRNA synthetase